MIRAFLRFIRRWLRRLIKGVFWVVLAYPFLLVLMYLTDDAIFPNGAMLKRNMDWEMLYRYDFERRFLTRGDLYLPDRRLIARRVDLLCWNETAISGAGDPHGFVWLGPGHDVIYRGDPGYEQAYEASGLGDSLGGCNGFRSKYVDPDMLIRHKKLMRPLEWPPPDGWPPPS